MQLDPVIAAFDVVDAVQRYENGSNTDKWRKAFALKV